MADSEIDSKSGFIPHRCSLVRRPGGNEMRNARLFKNKLLHLLLQT